MEVPVGLTFPLLPQDKLYEFLAAVQVDKVVAEVDLPPIKLVDTDIDGTLTKNYQLAYAVGNAMYVNAAELLHN